MEHQKRNSIQFCLKYFTKQFCSQCEEAENHYLPAVRCSPISRKDLTFSGTFQTLWVVGTPVLCHQLSLFLEMALFEAEGIIGRVVSRAPPAPSINLRHAKLLEPKAVCLVFCFPDSLRCVQTGFSEAIPPPLKVSWECFLSSWGSG